MNKDLKEVFVKQMLLPKEELALQTMELLLDKMDLEDRINKAIEYIDKMTEKELNYIIYKGEEHLVCGSDFGDGAWIIEEILKGDKE